MGEKVETGDRGIDSLGGGNGKTKNLCYTARGRIGFESIVIENLENNQNLKDVVINVLKGISKELDIPLGILFGKL